MVAPSTSALETGSQTSSPRTIVVRLAVAAILVYLAYVTLVDRSRMFEASVVGAMVERFVGDAVDRSYVDLGVLYVYPSNDGAAFVARITRGCSVLTSLAVITWVALCATRGRFPRRLLAFLVAAAAVVVSDLVRVVGVLLAGSYFGSDALILAHDWVGTLLTLVSLVIGIGVLWAVSGGRTREPNAAT